VIYGYLDVLDRPISDEQRANVLASMRRATRRMDRMLSEAVRGEIAGESSTRVVNLAPLVLRQATDWATASGREIDVVVEHDATVVGNEDHLAEVLDNLLGNAIKYSPEDEPVRVELARTETEAVIRVEDHGPGVPEQDRERILERSTRLDRDVEIPGAGIGLSVVREVVEEHGGTIPVCDSDEGGACFQIALPLAL
jgi:two-component system OmpR family sensor kinase